MSTCYKCEFDTGFHSGDCPKATEHDKALESKAENEVSYYQEHSGDSHHQESYHSRFA